MNQLLQETWERTREMVGDDHFYFHNPVSVRYSDEHWPFEAFGICAGPKAGLVFVLDGGGEWHPLTEAEKDRKVLEAVHKRVGLMHSIYKQNFATA